MLLVFALYMTCRIEFLLENSSLFSVEWFSANFWHILAGGLRFDASAICYTNSLYLLLLLLPLHYKEKKVYHIVLKCIFVIVNMLCVMVNLVDSVYFKFATHRASISTFSEFSGEGNLWKVFGVEFASHWYLVLLFILMSFLLWKGYRQTLFIKGESLKTYYLYRTLALISILVLTVFGMRGAAWQKATRPITVSNAHQYVDQAIETNIVLNSPFIFIRTSHRKAPEVPRFYADQKELDAIYSPLHTPLAGKEQKRKNVVVLIVEDLSREFIGSLNTQLEDGKYRGYTPFIDSLLTQSLSYDRTFSNGVTSIDGMPAVLASIPHGRDPFVLSTYSLNRINSIATELKNWGYSTAFFHGAMNGSMGFDAFASQAGFDTYYGRTEYDTDDRFNGDKDFDGTWAIWDEEFLQYYALKMTEMKQPFVTSVFTATSHHPYAIPSKYKDVFKEEGQDPVNKCIRYTDYSIRKFFETASKQPWYANTIFVLTADHANPYCTHEEYKVPIGHCEVPILIYDPSGDIKAEMRHGIMQQIDIMPSLLSYMGYDRPFVAFGRNIFAEDEQHVGWATNWHSQAQYIYDDYYMEMDINGNVTSLYNYIQDPLFKTNLAGKGGDIEQVIKRQFKAYMQSYFSRMDANKLTAL